MKVFWKLFTGIFIVSTLFVLSISSLFLPDTVHTMNLAKKYQPPSFSHPFGLNENGVDVLLLLLQGSRVSLFVACTVVFISLIVGLVMGTLSGYYTKVLDPILMRIVDMTYAFPSFLLAMALMAVLGSSVWNLIFVLSISTWATYARLIRGEILYLKKKEFVQSAESLGASLFRKIIVHIWPNLIPIVTVQTVLTLSSVILSESGLSFLGIGIPPEIPTWGSLLQSGRQTLIEAPHLSIFPGASLFILVLGFYLLGEGLRETLSPHSLKIIKKSRS